MKEGPVTQARVIFGTVVNGEAREMFQALRLVQSLRWFGGPMQDAPVAVCVTGVPDRTVAAGLERFGAEIWPLASGEAPRCCPAAALLAREELADYDVAIALAPNTLICRPPEALAETGALRARPADVKIFPDEAVERVFHAFDLPRPEPTYRTAVDGAPIAALFDAAVVSAPRQWRQPLAQAWRDHALRLEADPMGIFKEADVTALSQWHKPLRRHRVIEGLALALALAETETPVDPLPVELNCPASYPSKAKLASVRPVICRYQPAPPGKPAGSLVHYFMPRVPGGIAEAIDAFNERLAGEIRSASDSPAGAAVAQIDPPVWDRQQARSSPIRRDVRWTLRKRPDLRIMIGASPRTGNNWLVYLLAEAYRLPRLVRIGPAENVRLIKPQTPFVLYQHVPPTRWLLDWGADRDVKFVTMTRHPADVFLSLYHLVNDYHRTGLGGDFNKQYGVEKLIGQPLDSPSVYDFLIRDFGQVYISLYWVLSGRSLVVRYEDLHADPERALTELTNQIMPVDASDIRRAIRRCSKARMRRKSRFMRFSVRRGDTGEGAVRLNERHLAILRRRLADELPLLGYEI